jgi:protein-S-isoprenylcysteine O-methyltransferase Ste14
MLPEIITASILTVCLAAFFAVNLYNIAKFHRSKRDVKVYAEIKLSKSLILLFTAFGTVLFFLESLLFSFLAFIGFTSALDVFPLQLRFQHDSYLQIAGIVLSGAGYFLFIWSVVARGKYAVSWAMAENHKLVTWGPYRYVRHPSYLGYFLMFSGLFLIWLNLVATFPLVAIPDYMQVAKREEELLTHRFGEEYINYLKTTGRFLPRLSRTKRTRD